MTSAVGELFTYIVLFLKLFNQTKYLSYLVYTLLSIVLF